jgi:nucleoside-diphosphate-sugar epimerase
MGPTLAVMAKRAAAEAGRDLRVIAVSRFRDSRAKASLEEHGVETMVCDLLDQNQADRLPDAPDVLYLAGVKFGTQEDPALTWASNTIIPIHVMTRFSKSRMVALSTGNVYPLVPVSGGGAVESHPLTPVGEYANAAVARERLFEFHSRKHDTPMVLVRLNYAVELRYGVLHDLARKVWTGQAVDLANGCFNCIWQRDANEAILRLLPFAAIPPLPLNLTGPETLSVRAVATRFGEWMKKPVHFMGTESETALLSNPAQVCQLLGTPATPLEMVLRWTAHWVMSGGASLGKPTHFEVRDGQY